MIAKQINGTLDIKGILNMEKNGDLGLKEMHKAYIEENFQRDVEREKDVLKIRMAISLMESSKKGF